MRADVRSIALFAFLVGGCATSSAATGPASTKNGPAQHAYDAGNAFAARGDYVRAEQYFVSALRHGHPDTRVIVKLLRVCLSASRIRAALGYAQLYLIRHPRAWALRYLAATLHAALDQPAAARAQLAQVLEAQPAHEASLRLLAHLHPSASAPLVPGEPAP